MELQKGHRPQELRVNFLSIDRLIAMNSDGDYFKVGDVVGHEGADPNESATINKFTVDKKFEEVKVYTTRGTCHLDFIYLK